MESLIDLESEDYCHEGSEGTNARKDCKTDKRKTCSELKQNRIQIVSHAVSHSHPANGGKTNYILRKA